MIDFLCRDRLRMGFALRAIITLIILTATKYFKHHEKNLLLLLVVKLILLDAIDSIPTLYYQANDKTCWNPCTLTNFYQNWDKIIDLFSYLYIFILLDYDMYLLILIIWRFFGVFLLYRTNNRKWLVPFFDFVKEYLLYLYFFGTNYKYIGLFFVGKIIFEYYMHVYRLSSNRCLNKDKRS